MRPSDVRKKMVARIAVVRVSTLAEPRADMNPPPPPIPSAPPSDRCSNTTATSATTTIRWITMMTVCIDVSDQNS
ncbi:MAG: hypothetical protein ABS35_40605 [Kaistia sp. SCN 65-12]|nr:MAG: hypothetical protein ABS35_40605 [Kaistia sp. SCN 65-12]